MQNLVLENYGTSELSFDEMQEVDGGGGKLPKIPKFIKESFWGTLAYSIIADWEENMAAFNEGQEAAKKHSIK